MEALHSVTKKSYSFIFSLLICAAGAAKAVPITMTEQATASGFLDGSTFTNALVTVMFFGDTANVITLEPGVLGISGTGTATVAGIGTDTFSDTLQVYLYASGGRVGFEDNSASSSSVVLETDNSGTNGWGLTTSIGPLTGPSFIATSESNSMVNGTFGILSVSGNTSTFTATVGAVPEPGSFLMLGVGIAGIAGSRIQRFRQGRS
jgi:hypothetical protein